MIPQNSQRMPTCKQKHLLSRRLMSTSASCKKQAWPREASETNGGSLVFAQPSPSGAICGLRVASASHTNLQEIHSLVIADTSCEWHTGFTIANVRYSNI